jgi:hypothetical protein
MKRIILLMLSLLLLLTGPAKAQTGDSTKTKAWNFEATTMMYIVPEDVYVLPIIKADRNKLHLEARYNYEDFKTFSMFGGYNFSGGNKLQYTITPMLGFAVGNTDGIAPGLEMDFTLGKFELYSEMEYLFELNDKTYSYYYNWSEITFAPTDWMWFGISGQRIRPYETELGVERGATLGFSFKNVSLSGYYFNPFTEDDYGIVSLAVTF